MQLCQSTPPRRSRSRLDRGRRCAESSDRGARRRSVPRAAARRACCLLLLRGRRLLRGLGRLHRAARHAARDRPCPFRRAPIRGLYPAPRHRRGGVRRLRRLDARLGVVVERRGPRARRVRPRPAVLTAAASVRAPASAKLAAAVDHARPRGWLARDLHGGSDHALAAPCLAGITRPGEQPAQLPAHLLERARILATIGVLLALGIASNPREARAARALAAAGVPIAAATLFLTFSRGAIGALAIGLVVYS